MSALIISMPIVTDISSLSDIITNRGEDYIFTNQVHKRDINQQNKRYNVTDIRNFVTFLNNKSGGSTKRSEANAKLPTDEGSINDLSTKFYELNSAMNSIFVHHIKNGSLDGFSSTTPIDSQTVKKIDAVLTGVPCEKNLYRIYRYLINGNSKKVYYLTGGGAPSIYGPPPPGYQEPMVPNMPSPFSPGQFPQIPNMPEYPQVPGGLPQVPGGQGLPVSPDIHTVATTLDLPPPTTEKEVKKLEQLKASMSKVPLVGSTAGYFLKSLIINDPAGSLFSKFLDVIQFIVDFVGLIPGIGDVIDLVNAILYLLRGRWADALLSFIAFIPIVGSVIAIISRETRRLVKANKLLKMARKVYKTGKKMKGVVNTMSDIRGSFSGQQYQQYGLPQQQVQVYMPPMPQYPQS